MKFSALVVSTLPLAVYALPPGTFSYKPDSDKAPLSWSGLDLGQNADGADIDNQCGGAAQSGIDVPTSTCDVFDDYVFSVSTFLACFSRLVATGGIPSGGLTTKLSSAQFCRTMLLAGVELFVH
jgi:hypothetical protein